MSMVLYLTNMTDLNSNAHLTSLIRHSPSRRPPGVMVDLSPAQVFLLTVI